MKLYSWISEKLVRRLVAPSLALAVLAVLFLSIVTYHSVRNILVGSVTSQLQVAVDLQENEIKRWLDDQKIRVVFLARAPVVREKVADLLTRQTDHPYYRQAYRELSEYLFSFIKNFPGLREVMVLSGRGGEVLFSTTTENEQEFRAKDTFFLKGQSDLVVQGVYPWRENAEPTITIARPLLDANGEKKGVLAVHLNLQRMDEVVSNHPGLGRTGEIYLVDKYNSFINAERFGRENFPRGVHTQGIDRAIAGGEGVSFYTNYMGVPVVGYSRWMPEIDIAIIAEIEQEEAFAPARQIGFVIASLGLLLTVFLAFGITFFTRKVSDPLRIMANVARKVADGDFSTQVPLGGRDETGVLAASFNRMVSHLQDVYRQLENSAEYFRTVFNLSPYAIAVQRQDNGAFVNVNEKFCDMFDVPVERALGRSSQDLRIWRSDFSRRRLGVLLRRHNEVIDFESEFARGDDTVFRGVISSRILELSGGTFIVSILVDISALRKTEKELQETTDRLRLLINRMPIGFITWTPDFTVSMWNPDAERIFGFSEKEALGRHAYELIVPKDVQPHVEPIWKKLLDGDETAHSENPNITADGRTIICEWYNTPLKDEDGTAIGVISMVRDVTLQKAAEVSLKNQKELLQTIMNAIPAPIFFKDINGVYQGCNVAFCEYIGLGHDQIVGHTAFDIAPEDKARVYEEADRQLIESGGIQVYEAKVRFADGKDRDVVFHKAVYRNADGSVGGLVGNMLDVTEIRRAEDELAESELNYREIFNASSEAIIIRDIRTGEVQDVNQAMLDMYGYEYDEALLTTIADLTGGEPPYTVEKAYEMITRAKKGEPQLFEWKARKKDGTRFWVEIALKQSVIRGQNRIIAVIRDIGERKEAERAQRESDERFHLLIEHAADSLFLHNENGDILTVNQRACEKLGYSREDLVGMRIEQVEKGVTLEQLKSFWSELETGRATLIEGEHLCRDGSSFPVDVNVVKFEFRGTFFFLALARDVTERKETEAELERYRNHLEELVMERSRQLEAAQEELILKERLAVLGQLTATVSHELRNPLGTVKNALYLLGKQHELGVLKNVDRTLDLADRNIRRCDNIINELLDYTRQQELSVIRVPVEPWLRDILEEIRTPDGITIEVKAPEGLGAEIDPERMRRVMINVLSNSIQALQEKKAGKKKIGIELAQDEGDLVIRVVDSGPGIPDEVLQRIFEPMFSTKSFGVGLGMAIVRNIIEEHSGSIEVTSKPGRTTTVTMKVPLRHQKKKKSAREV